MNPAQRSRNLTKQVVDAIPFPKSGQIFYRDTKLRGFGLRVGAKTKTYIVETKVNGKVCRYTIGKHGLWTAEKARKEAREKLVGMSKGQNPNDQKKAKRAAGVTLRQAFEEFKAFKQSKKARKQLKPTTLAGYERVVSLYLADWQNKPLTAITKDMVERRHKKLSEPWSITIEKQEHSYRGSPAQADLAMRFLRRLFNYAAGKYQTAEGAPLITSNPVKRLSEAEAWNDVDPRDSVITPEQLPVWFRAVLALKNDDTSEKREVVRDYLLLVLFTGLRRLEAARLTWDHVDFAAKTLTIPDTKNKKPLTLPMSDYVFDLLHRRKQGATGRFVFPGDGAHGYIVEPRKPMAHVTRESGVEFTLHDLRRTFVTIAESLDISAYAIKGLVNHSGAIKVGFSQAGSDITEDYVVLQTERLRGPMQRIADYILKTVGVRESAEVVALPQSRNAAA